ncbi:hypothetical protein ACFFGR_09525 [Arthrobacter liuii]|uniref:DUF2442 domain-containing protein n=1 Tax=Arthrobacter liuii TaxID=1476996 RepID=A0ABQ2AQH5_9MICC|nr:hypothetical protein [Arthrobacter liuii]GGH93961.1 hypothetical protein GCM10007170_16050 [Arthrobacter liuii]
MSTATPIRQIRNMQGNATLYRMDPPLCDNEYVVVSAVDIAARFPGFGLRLWESTETYIFPADEDGEIADWGELPGSTKGTLDHTEALRSAGYEVAA